MEKSVRSGSGIPSAGLGVAGDFYINTATNMLYGPKSGSSWGTGISLIGATGAQGPIGATGATGATGVAGSSDSYFMGNTGGSLLGLSGSFLAPVGNELTSLFTSISDVEMPAPERLLSKEPVCVCACGTRNIADIYTLQKRYGHLIDLHHLWNEYELSGCGGCCSSSR